MKIIYKEAQRKISTNKQKNNGEVNFHVREGFFHSSSLSSLLLGDFLSSKNVSSSERVRIINDIMVNVLPKPISSAIEKKEKMKRRYYNLVKIKIATKLVLDVYLKYRQVVFAVPSIEAMRERVADEASVILLILLDLPFSHLLTDET